MSVIANTTIISNFASLEALNLLRHCWPNLYISEQVFTEIQTGLEQGYTFYAGIERMLFPLAEDGWLKLTSMQTEAERIQYRKTAGQTSSRRSFLSGDRPRTQLDVFDR